MKSLRCAGVLSAAVLSVGAAFSQGLDFSGYWQPGKQQDAGLGTAAGEMLDYGGIPVSEAGRLYSLAWTASRLSLRQHQCTGYVSPYLFVAPGFFRFWEERDPATQKLVAIRLRANAATPNRTIWMDGRPHPPEYAQHTWAGFSTGKYEGDILTDRVHHAYEAGTDPGKWSGPERSGDAGGAFYPARGPHHLFFRAD
jgi:hypothetical protein